MRLTRIDSGGVGRLWRALAVGLLVQDPADEGHDLDDDDDDEDEDDGYGGSSDVGDGEEDEEDEEDEDYLPPGWSD